MIVSIMPGKTFNEPLTPRGDVKRRAILDVACEAFLQKGYADTSMSNIAAQVGGSKATLYSYFPSKEGIFEAAIEHQFRLWSNRLFSITTVGGTLEEHLMCFATGLLDIVLEEKFMAFTRLISAEALRFPDIGKTYYQACVRYGFTHLASYLAEAMEAGLIRQADPLSAAEYLNDLVQSGVVRRRMLNVEPKLDQSKIDAHAEEAVRIFLSGFATDQVSADRGASGRVMA